MLNSNDMNEDILKNTILSKDNLVKKYLKQNPDSYEIYKLSEKTSNILFNAKTIEDNEGDFCIFLNDLQKKEILGLVKETAQICFKDSKVTNDHIIDLLKTISVFEIYTSKLERQWQSNSLTNQASIMIDKSPRLNWKEFLSEMDDTLNNKKHS